MLITKKTAKKSDLHVENVDRGLNHLQNAGIHDEELNNAALEAASQEHSLSVWAALRTYKRAAFWSMS